MGIIQLFNMMLEAADNQELFGVCLLDQSAAYDLLCHNTLKQKLKLYNFSEASIDWLISYLGGRTQIVQVESRLSHPLNCDDTGVPQGSVLGGLLHVINSNDFPACHEVGESVVYVDDDSDCVCANEPDELRDLIEQEAGHSAQWLQDNRLCVAGEKSKLLVIGTNQMRSSKLSGELKIIIDGKEVTETGSEKLLGVVMNNQLTWKHHLYGDQENEGLIPQLGRRIGMMKRLAKYMSRDKLKYFANSIFYSKLSYCLPVFGNTFGLDTYKAENTRYTSFTMKDNQKLQVLQNKLNRLLTGTENHTPTAELLSLTDSMSVHQMIAYQTLVTTHKIVNSGKPTYIAQKMKTRVPSMKLRGRLGSIQQAGCSLSITKEGFIYRGANLFNKISENLRNESEIKKFKSGAKTWVLKNIPIKPSSRHPHLAARNNVHRPAPPPPPIAPPHLSQNSIRRYLVPPNRLPPVDPNPTTSQPTSPARLRPPSSTPRLHKPAEKATIKSYFQPIQQHRQRHPVPQPPTQVQPYKTPKKQILPPDN